MTIAASTANAFPITVALDRRRIFVLPSRHGIAFAAALVVMLVGSMNYANSLGYLLSFLLASVALVSLLHTYRNLAGVSICVAEPTAVFATGRLVVPVSIDNRGAHTRRAVCITYPEVLGVTASHRGWRRTPAPRRSLHIDLPKDALVQIEVAVRTTERGRHSLRGLEIATRFPLGLFRAWSPLRPAARASHDADQALATVYPAPVGNLPLPYSASDSVLAHRPGQPGNDDFSGLRDYQFGDSPRRIHWKAAARGTQLPVKEFDGAAAAVVVLSWTATAALGQPEARLSQLARWIVDADRMGSTYALELPAQTIELGSGPAHRARALLALAEFDADAPAAHHTQAARDREARG